MIKIVSLGGLGEIGLNFMTFEYEGKILIIDAGLMFPEDYMLGVDLVVPDMEYIRQNQAKIVGIVLTHAHEDHIGALPYLVKFVKAPIYATPFTLRVVRQKLEERELLPLVTLHEFLPGEPIRVGDFEIDTIRVAHSVVDGVALAIRTPLGLIVHTGDFKISQSIENQMVTDVAKFAKCGEEGVLVLLSDSTNIEKDGYTKSDKQIGETLEQICMKRNGRIIIALFASNIIRIQQIIDIAKKRKSKIIFNGKSIDVTVRIARELGYLNFQEDMLIDVEAIHDYPDKDIIIITTGSQGEPMSALARMASGIHKQIKIKPNDTVILSSKFIPGNERAITTIINSLYRRGADVIYEKISEIHTSGHAFREELKLMIYLTRPKYFIPIHGEYRHLVLHAQLAQQLGIPKSNILLMENGQIVEFDGRSGKITGSINTGRILIDGKGIGDVGRSILKERRVLSEEGLVAVTIAFDEETGIIIYGPEIDSRGFVFENKTGYLLEDAICVILEIVEDVKPETTDRLNIIRSRIQTDLRKYFDFAIKRRPFILPFVIEL